MPQRSRRLRKKLHARYADEIILAALSSDELAPEIRALQPNQVVHLRAPAPRDFPESARLVLNRWSLWFELSLAEPAEVPPDPLPDPGASLFKLKAARFPTVCVFAEEHLEQLGSGRAA